MDLARVSEVAAERFDENPLVTPASDGSLGDNVDGPSVIRVPDWIDDPLGTYYMYFAHHNGEYIRLAYADDLRGPWTVYGPGTLHIEPTQFDHHVASPDVHVDHDERRIRMYFHGCCGDYRHSSGVMNQPSDVATSTNGLDFEVRAETVGKSYFRVWEYEGTYYAVANDGNLYRSEDPLSEFERRHTLFEDRRHFAVRFADEDTLQIYLSRLGDRPERIMVTEMDLGRPVDEWEPTPLPPETVLYPLREYEGAAEPLVTSESGSSDEPLRQLQDPAIFEEDGRVFLFYAIAAERGIAGAELVGGT